MNNFDYPQLCTKCQGYKTIPYSWNSTNQPKMCVCSSVSLAWECPRCKKINAPWKGSCDCTHTLSSAHTTINYDSLNKNFTDK